MTDPITLVAQPLTASAFVPFGEVIHETDAPALPINGGTSDRFDELIRPNFGQGGRANLSIFRVRTAITEPYRLPLLECHPLGSQTFLPRGHARFLIVVAPPGPQPALDRLAAFITDGEQGVNYHPGVWHLPLASLTTASFFVLDRSGEGENCLEFDLSAQTVIGTWSAA